MVGTAPGFLLTGMTDGTALTANKGGRGEVGVLGVRPSG